MKSEDLVRSLANELEPVRRLSSVEWRTAVWIAVAVCCAALGTWALGPRADLSAKLRDPVYLGESALLFLIFVLSARSAFHLSVPGAERSTQARALPIAGLLVWAGLLAVNHPAEAMAAPAGWSCVLKMICVVLTPSLAVLYMLRKGAPLSPGWTGWFGLLSAGSLALLGTRILCSKDGLQHVLFWHLAPLLLATFVGIHLGRWLFNRPLALPRGDSGGARGSLG
jgi:hypothetical protein